MRLADATRAIASVVSERRARLEEDMPVVLGRRTSNLEPPRPQPDGSTAASLPVSRPRRPRRAPEAAWPLCSRLTGVLNEREALVLEVKPWDVHGVAYVDVTVVYEDRAMETARLGPESVPEDLKAGERVMVRRAVNMIVAIERA